MSIYLDSASTTKVKQEVIDAMMPYFTEKWYNPSSMYSKATEVKKDIESAKKTIANYINADSNEIIFTSGGSEGNCFAIQGFINHCRRKGREATVITSTIEHKSIIACVENMNVDVHFVGVDKEGFVDVKAMESLVHDAYIEANDILVSIQFANNEIGTIQHIKEIAKLIHKYGAVFHTDAVQAFGQIDIDVKDLDVDMLSVSGHKIHTPKGIGFLYKKNSIEINPLIYGSQEGGLRGGTENVPYIMGFKKAIELLQKHEFNRQMSMILWRNDLISRLKAIGCTVHGSLSERLPNNINIAFPQKATGEALIYMLDTSGIYISAGSACNSHSTSISHVLQAVGLSEDEALRTIRITLSDTVPCEERDILTEHFINEFKKQLEILDISQT